MQGTIDMKWFQGIGAVSYTHLIAGSKSKILQAEMAYDPALIYSKETLEDSVYRVQVMSKLLSYSIDAEVRAEEFNLGFIRFDYAGESLSLIHI